MKNTRDLVKNTRDPVKKLISVRLKLQYKKIKKSPFSINTHHKSKAYYFLIQNFTRNPNLHSK